MTTEVSPHQLDIDGFTQGRPYTLVLPSTDLAGDPVTPSSAVLYAWNMLGTLVATITATITAGRVEFDLVIVKRTVYRHEIVLSGHSSLKGTFEVRPQSDGHGTSNPRTTWPITITEGVTTVPVTVSIEVTGAVRYSAAWPRSSSPPPKSSPSAVPLRWHRSHPCR